MNTISNGRLRGPSSGPRVHRAFTLVELMMVISIIALLAALIVWGASVAGDKKVRARVNTEMEGIKLAIDGFHKKHGFYPPGNVNPALAGTNQLFYELTGTVHANNATSFKDMLGDTIDSATIKNTFGVDGFVNSAEARNDLNFMPGLRPDGYGQIPNSSVRVLTFPYRGAVAGFVPWHYNPASPEHNPDSYDLWVEVQIGKNIVTLGNWKD